MTELELLEWVQRVGGFETEVEARAAIEGTLTALGAMLFPDERRTVAEALPPTLRACVQTAERATEMSLDSFLGHVRQHEGVRPGRAKEHAEIICGALAVLLPEDTVTLLRRRLSWLSGLFEVAEAPGAPEEPERTHRPPEEGAGEHRKSNTLAEGRPGSARPLSDATPDRAQTHSVARSEDPHGDTKLSGARGYTQERERETLADGRPGFKRPLSG